MAKYELPQYQSMYVDPQSVAINTELRQRFVDSFAADDTLQATVDGMEVADFEGDINRKNQLADEYNEQIRARAERGDYETLGMSISRDARNFIKDYTPLQRNKEQYDNYIKTVGEAEKLGAGKPGGIDSSTAAKLKKYAVHNYDGLEYDENGNLNRESYFSAPGFVGEVNEYELIKEEMADVVARQDPKNLGFEVPLDSQGRPIIENGIINGVPRYWMTTKSGREYIDENLVANATNRVLNRADVKGAFNQRALLDTYMYDEIVDDQGTTAAQVQLDEMQMSLEDDINALNQKGGALTADETTKLNDLQEQLENLIESRQENGDMSTLQNIDLNNKMNEFYKSNVTKYAYDKEEYARTYDDDKEWLANNTGSENINNPQYVYTPSLAMEVPSLGGKDTDSLNSFIQEKETSIQTTLDYFSNLEGVDISQDEILVDLLNLDDFGVLTEDGTYSETIQQLSSKYNVTPEVFIEKAKQTQINKQKQLLAQQRKKEAETTVFEGDYNAIRSEEFAELTKTSDSNPELAINGVDIKNALVKIGAIDKNASVKDALDYLYKTAGGFSNIKMSTAASENLLFGFGESGHALLQALLADKSPNAIYDSEAAFTTNASTEQSAMNYQLADFLKDYTTSKENDEEELNKHYQANVKTDTGWNMNDFGDTENSKEVKAAFKSTFKDPSGFLTVPIFNTWDENADPNESYTIAHYIEKNGGLFTDGNVEINADNISLSSVVRADGVSTITIPLTNTKDGKPVHLIARADGVGNPALEKWTSSAEYEAGKLWQMGIQAHLTSGRFEPELLEGIVFDYNNNQVIINGTPNNMAQGLQKVANMLNRVGYAKSMGGLDVDKDKYKSFFEKLKVTNNK